MQSNKRIEFAIGIDPGTHCGLTIWDVTNKKLVEIKTMKIHQALDLIKKYHQNHSIQVVWEDARLWTYHKGTDRAKLQGAGSIKRDCTILNDFFDDYKIPHIPRKPNKSITKLSKEQFIKLTKYTGVTSSHGRDSAMLVYEM